MIKKLLANKRLLADVILIASLLVLSLSVFLITSLSRDEGAVAVVSVDGAVVAEYPLSRDGEYSLNGGTNILVIKNGKAYIGWADCPRQICVKDGSISRTGERITCLENRVIIEVFGAGDGALEV